MYRKRKLSNLSDKCRICLADHGSMTQIFDELLQDKIRDLSKCTSIDIKDERDLPRIICHVCLYKLEMWNEFKEQFVQSNALLSSHLELSENSESTVMQNKRKCMEAEECQGENVPNDGKTKRKPDIPPLIPLEGVGTDTPADKKNITNMCMSEDDPASSKDSFQKDISTPNTSNLPAEVKIENVDESELKSEIGPAKNKLLNLRRSKATERRIASTKRWVERKKALIAATGENISDTDSIGSDDTQLSPVQKARAKTNADKEAEKQKRIARALKNLETNMTEKYSVKRESDCFAFGDTDSDARITRSHKMLTNDISPNNENMLKKEHVEAVTNKNVSPPPLSKETENCTVSVVNDTADNSLPKNTQEHVDEKFTPNLVKTELEVGDATYIVTSKLVLAEPNDVQTSTLNNMPEEAKDIDENNQEKNTDIIDAVQLRRVNPAPSTASEKKSVERCLNIEVEGSELETLKRVQIDLANFVEKEMKNRLCGVRKKRGRPKSAKSRMSTLNEQLKTIVEKVIKKNFEMSMMNSASGASENTPSTFVETAMNLPNFQPKVVLHPLNIHEESQRYKISNISTLQDTEGKDFNKSTAPTSRKRKHLLPARYSEYITSGMDSDTIMSQEKKSFHEKTDMKNTEIFPKPQSKELHTFKRGNINTIEHLEAPTCEVVECDTTTASTTHNSAVANEVDSVTVNPIIAETPQGIVYANSFDSKDMKIQNISQKIDTTSNTVPVRQNKQKLMRCKRCHEIVEARLVKQHVCRSKYAHKCYVCNSTFRTEKILARHLKSHDQSEFKLDVAKIDPTKASNTSTPQNSLAVPSVNVDQVNDKVLQEDVSTMESKKEIYTCFVCNKTFTDEEILKDHLQKHCDDMSEDEDSGGKEQYQCAICGDSMESEDALEEHVEKHLFNDEDDNPNLISIGGENEKKDTTYSCSQCTEVFNSEMLLEMHMQAHEEEAAIAEWERQGMKVYEYQCMICDEIFGTEEELSDHLDVHNANAHVCQLCEKPFATLEDLQSHVASH